MQRCAQARETGRDEMMASWGASATTGRDDLLLFRLKNGVPHLPSHRMRDKDRQVPAHDAAIAAGPLPAP